MGHTTVSAIKASSVSLWDLAIKSQRIILLCYKDYVTNEEVRYKNFAHLSEFHILGRVETHC